MLRAILTTFALLSAPSALALAPTKSAPLADGPPVCLAFWTEARFVGFAYNHIVHVANGCNVPMFCTVTTTVNPEPLTVTVPSGSNVEVVTFIGSPASAFSAAVLCARQPAA